MPNFSLSDGNFTCSTIHFISKIDKKAILYGLSGVPALFCYK